LRSLQLTVKQDYAKIEPVCEKAIQCLEVANDKKLFELPEQKEVLKNTLFEISKVKSEIILYDQWQRLLSEKLKDS